LALLDTPDTMVLVPSRAKQRNVPKLKCFFLHWAPVPSREQRDNKHDTLYCSNKHKQSFPLFLTAGHVVRTQHCVTECAGQRRCYVEVRHYLHDAAGSRSLVFDLSITQYRIGSSCHVQQNGLLSYPQDLDDPLLLAAQRKINSYRQ
jgi:hypothetical protein